MKFDHKNKKSRTSGMTKKLLPARETNLIRRPDSYPLKVNLYRCGTVEELNPISTNKIFIFQSTCVYYSPPPYLVKYNLWITRILVKIPFHKTLNN
ncbi:hypothetical protein A3B93_00710 [Candidatus Nomurabacteria bacterium RIFCSPHIGHO2_02_FULL_42_24]|uniref:Uncharacterized protein n=1 Tax=Candidatus Nomurabacteria bacterium RIFCSPHIGHO2_02_FULL_42_24 TaxID=1801757 RepID=A0A1F6WI13_9BACT|nr:MAG: hypothetical protein A3B93_00710 [Candidatus Nomurabacteria bacterium RIFCSPHIGHO2_02_FULL_42_24]